jgi:hypothetical protein
MTAVLDWRGVPPYVLGLARAVAALVGILATVVYPSVHARLQTVRTGVWSIWLQCSLLSICVASTWVQSPRVASIMLIAGVAASRLGLWMFDLSVTQLMQESVPEAERGVVGGVQKSLQSLMDMLTYVVGLVISNPKVGTSNRGSQMSKGLMLWLIQGEHPLPFLHLPLHTLFPFFFLLYPPLLLWFFATSPKTSAHFLVIIFSVFTPK